MLMELRRMTRHLKSWGIKKETRTGEFVPLHFTKNFFKGKQKNLNISAHIQS